jgi:hypothetical protein
MEFVFKVVAPNARAACTVAKRITRLYHELFDYSMKYVAVVVAVARMNCKVFNCFRTSYQLESFDVAM